MIPNPWIILAAVGIWLATGIGCAGVCYRAGSKAEQSSQLREQAAADKAAQIASLAAADAISKIEVKNTTIRQRVEAVTHEKIVYRDCRHDAGVLLDINEALTGTAAVSGGKLPAAGPND